MVGEGTAVSELEVICRSSWVKFMSLWYREVTLSNNSGLVLKHRERRPGCSLRYTVGRFRDDHQKLESEV